MLHHTNDTQVSPDSREKQTEESITMKEWVKATDAAVMAQTQRVYLYKLIREGAIESKAEKVGLKTVIFVNTKCLRFLQLMDRLQTPDESTDSSTSPFKEEDWTVWENMVLSGRVVVNRPSTPATVKIYRYCIKRFFKYHNVINAKTFWSFVDSNWSNLETPENDFFTTKQKCFQAVLSALKYLVHVGRAKPEDIVDYQKAQPKRRVKGRKVRWHDIEQIDNAIDLIPKLKSKRENAVYTTFNQELNRALLIVAKYGSLRAGEIAGIRLKDLNHELQSCLVFGKGSAYRTIYFCDEAWQAITKWLAVRPDSTFDNVFLSDRGLPLKGPYISRRFKRLGKWSGFVLSAHDVRRTSLTWLINDKEVPLGIVRDHAGHSNLTTTNRYVKSTEKQMRKAMRGL